jgi:hypothetical protein
MTILSPEKGQAVFRCMLRRFVVAFQRANARNIGMLMNESEYLSEIKGGASSPAAETAGAPRSRCDDGMNILGIFIEFTLTA